MTKKIFSDCATDYQKCEISNSKASTYLDTNKIIMQSLLYFESKDSIDLLLHLHIVLVNEELLPLLYFLNKFVGELIDLEATIKTR